MTHKNPCPYAPACSLVAVALMKNWLLKLSDIQIIVLIGGEQGGARGGCSPPWGSKKTNDWNGGSKFFKNCTCRPRKKIIRTQAISLKKYLWTQGHSTVDSSVLFNLLAHSFCRSNLSCGSMLRCGSTIFSGPANYCRSTLYCGRTNCCRSTISSRLAHCCGSNVCTRFDPSRAH